MRRATWGMASVVVLLGLLGIGAGAGLRPDDGGEDSTPVRVVAAVPMPTYDHVVVVVLENKRYSQIVESKGYIKRLGDQGAEFTRSYAVTHPSQPNYIALFSGSTQGITDDSCPNTLTGPQLASQLSRSGHTFGAYSEGLPETGSRVCSSPSGKYRRKHAPWTNFSSFNQSKHKPFGRFPTAFGKLPTVSFVVPNMCHDMHDCSIATGNLWMRRHLDPYAQWAKTHNSLLVVTFDEDDDTAVNRIYTALIGAHVAPGDYDDVIDHYSLLRMLEDMYGLAHLGHAAQAPAITGIWN
jgi:hypothetical protein